MVKYLSMLGETISRDPDRYPRLAPQKIGYNSSRAQFAKKYTEYKDAKRNDVHWRRGITATLVAVVPLGEP